MVLSKFISILCFTFFLNFMGLRTYCQLPILIPYNVNGNWGYADSNGSVIIEPKFTRTFPFIEGVSRFIQNKQYGYLKINGDYLNTDKYDYAYDFCNGFARVNKKDKYGVINKKGELIIPFIGYTRCKPGVEAECPFYMIDIGEVMIGCDQILYDTLGNALTDTSKRVWNFNDADIARYDSVGKSGFINRKGKILVKAIYDDVETFGEGPIYYVEKKGKYGYINSKGQVVISFEYEKAKTFEYGFVAVKKGKWGLYKYNKEVVPFELDEIDYDWNKTMFLLRKNNNWEIKDSLLQTIQNLNLNGEIRKIDILGKNQTRYSIFQNDFSFYILDEKGNSITDTFKYPPKKVLDSAGYYEDYGYSKFDALDYSINWYSNTFHIWNGEKFGFIDDEGKILGSIKYDQVDFFWNELARVKIGSKYGYLKRNGVEITPEYNWVEPFYGNYARVRKNDKWGIINKDGKVIIDFKYDYIEGAFNNDIILVKMGNTEGYIDIHGREYFK